MAICLELCRTPNLPVFTVLSNKGDAMKRLLLAAPVAALVALLVSTPEASAFGRRKKGHDCPPPAPAQVSWVDQVVTSYRLEWKTRQVPVTVNRPVSREEVRTEKRTVMVPRHVQETRTQTVTVPRVTEETQVQTVTIPEQVQETR